MSLNVQPSDVSAENLVDEAAERIRKLRSDVLPTMVVVNKGLEYMINLVQALKQQSSVYSALESGLGMLLTFLMDSKMILEFGATIDPMMHVFTLFLKGVSATIRLAKKFMKSELGQFLVKFLNEHLFSKKNLAIAAA